MFSSRRGLRQQFSNPNAEHERLQKTTFNISTTPDPHLFLFFLHRYLRRNKEIYEKGVAHFVVKSHEKPNGPFVDIFEDAETFDDT